MDNQQPTASKPDIPGDLGLDTQRLQVNPPSQLEIWADLGLLLGNALSAVAYPALGPDFRRRDR